eukprot:TRINITY_DN122495_c0_g1_i1.p1 TRINITY_DN122495_c0_g1~~TRINITY_DN122495_c0_g1_i1.p1  ORF type:complete len:166 (+),score=43.84 TRINITY_DN122495_c0_g1_i1:101-598(+)
MGGSESKPTTLHNAHKVPIPMAVLESHEDSNIDELVAMTFLPGELGIHASNHATPEVLPYFFQESLEIPTNGTCLAQQDGVILRVTGLAKEMGIEPGWTIIAIDDEAYTSAMLSAKMGGEDGFVLTFHTRSEHRRKVTSCFAISVFFLALVLLLSKIHMVLYEIV